MTPPPGAEQLLRAAARDNARWCHLVASCHGIAGRTDGDAWAGPRRTPPGYPDAVTLRPGVEPADLLSRVDTAAPGCSVKDSFADLDLAPYRFRELFAATWIGHAAPDRAAPDGRLPWARVTDADTLSAWHDARGDAPGEHVLRPALLTEPEVTVLAGLDGTDVVAGGVLTTGDRTVVGVSNVFAAPGTAVEVAWAGLLGWTASHHGGRPLVGYEHGADLIVALTCGFVPLGPLRVWMATAPPGAEPASAR